MLSFQEKLDICASFPELTRKDVSLGRVNFSYEESAQEKKTVVYHLHPNGNGFVYAGLLPDVQADDKGFVNIREASEENLRALIARSIRSLSAGEEADAQGTQSAEPTAETAPSEEQVWKNAEGQTLSVWFEDELWYVYAGLNLDSAFETYEETLEYLEEEGFKRQA